MYLSFGVYRVQGVCSPVVGKVSIQCAVGVGVAVSVSVSLARAKQLVTRGTFNGLVRAPLRGSHGMAFMADTGKRR